MISLSDLLYSMIISRSTHVSLFLSFLWLRNSPLLNLHFKVTPGEPAAGGAQMGSTRGTPGPACFLSILVLLPTAALVTTGSAANHHRHRKLPRRHTWAQELRCSGSRTDAESASIPKDVCWAHLPRQALSPCTGRSWKQAAQVESMSEGTAAPGTVMEREKETDAVMLPREGRIFLGHWKWRVTFESSFNPWEPMMLNKSVCVYKTGIWKHPKYLQSYRNSDTAYRVITAYANSQNTSPVLLIPGITLTAD